jgi:hypothetical protein
MVARSLIVVALLARIASADAVATYRQLGTAAAAHGQREVAERYFRRWLAIEPGAALPAEASAAAREAFTAAQVFMAARSPLTARAEIRGGKVEVVIVADPLVMVAAVSIDGVRHDVGADQHVRAEASGRRAAVALLDERGNHLLELEAVSLDEPLPPAPERPKTSLVRQPIAWLVPAAGFGLAGVSFAFEAHQQQGQLDHLVMGTRIYNDVQDRHDRYVRIAEVGVAAAGACALTAAVMFFVEPKSSHVSPAPGGLAITF